MGVEHKLDSGVGLLSLLKSRIFKTPQKPNMSINADEVKKICAIYDWDAKGEIDMYYFMDIIKKTTVKFGQTDDFGKKFCKYDEVVKLMQEAVKEPDSTGNYHDYVELCKLYDKNENGTILLAELENILSNLGDMIPKEDCQKMLEELAPKEDEDGLIPYTPFLDKLCGKA